MLISQGKGKWLDPISKQLSKPCACGNKLDWTLHRVEGEWISRCCGNIYRVNDIYRVVKVRGGK